MELYRDELKCLKCSDSDFLAGDTRGRGQIGVFSIEGLSRRR